MLLDDILRNGKPNTRAGVLACDERVEDVGQDLSIDA